MHYLTTELEHSRLKYGLFSGVISCHDRSAQHCQNVCSKCAPYTDTKAYRRRRFSRVSLAPGKHNGVACSMNRGAVLLKHKKKSFTDNLCLALASKQKKLPRQYVLFTLTPNLSNLIVINPVLGKNLEHPRLTIKVVW